jgi:phytoene dehydrogenase-like protein
MAEYDCIVIGAGMAGLTFASLAGNSGKRVLVLEQHYLPGGCFTAFKNGPYVFNVALEWTNECAPGQRFHRLMEKLGLAEDYPFERIDVFKSVLSPELSQPVVIPTGTAPLLHSLTRMFPHQALEIQRFLDDCQAVLENDTHASQILMQRGAKPVEKTLADYFSDTLLIHTLFSLIAYPQARGVLLMYMIGAICKNQVWRPVHRDHRKLPALLHRRITRHGGNVLLRRKVSRVLVEDGKAAGVELDTGEQIRAETVVANTDPYQLYSELLCPQQALPRAIQAMLDRRPSLSCFCLFLGLKRPVPGLDQHAANFSLLAADTHWERSPTDLRAIPLRMEIQTANHPGLAPAGHATLCAWAALPMSAFDYWGQGSGECMHDPAAYESAKREAVEIVLGRLEAVFPRLHEDITLIDAATPFTFKRYTCSQEGAVSGYSLASMNYLKTLPNSTPVPGLYHVGQWTTQSGVNMAMYSGEDLHAQLYA